MALETWTINFTDGVDKSPFTLTPAETNGPTGASRTLDIELIGNGTPDWGEKMEENFVHLLENFSCPEDGGSPGNPDPAFTYAPTTPTKGQTWFNSTDEEMYVYDGTVWKQFGIWTIGTGDDIYYNTGVGNVGIGNSTLEAWHDTFSALQIGGNSAIWGQQAQGNGQELYIGQNVYSDGVDKYISPTVASRYMHTVGRHYFSVAPAGNADDPITWDHALIIDNNSNVGIGNSALEAWNATVTALQIGGRGAVFSDSSQLILSQNVYYDGQYKRIDTTGAAEVLVSNAGYIKMKVAGSASADSVITWEDALTFDTGGTVYGLAIKTEDDMVSNSTNHLASQQSIKAYVDSGTVTMTNKTLTSPVITGVPLINNAIGVGQTQTYSMNATVKSQNNTYSSIRTITGVGSGLNKNYEIEISIPITGPWPLFATGLGDDGVRVRITTSDWQFWSSTATLTTSASNSPLCKVQATHTIPTFSFSAAEVGTPGYGVLKIQMSGRMLGPLNSLDIELAQVTTSGSIDLATNGGSVRFNQVI